MSTAFKQLTGMLVAAMAALPALADGRVWPNRLRPLAATHNSAIVVRLDQTRAEQGVIGANDWQTRFAVECFGRGVSGADPADAADELLQGVWARIAALDAASLGVMAVAIDPAIEWQFDDGETPLACAIVYITVQHRTPANTLAVWS